ncbi:MAG: SDR family oxidoreductase [SAR202 cluster bacterium]|jgi:NAD(P)-dependent dehydrogenase (short-subunit alcohol dehydrogenase family)|nr:SDR family oxidoreductase [SAR202 cluster bacterium]
MGLLEGKTAIITGGATGIGRGIARAYAREGATLVLASRNRDNLERTASEFRSKYGVTVLVVPADATIEAEVADLFATTAKELGRLDILVNNAGTGIYVPLDEMSLENWETVFAVNLTAAFLCTREAIRVMKSQGGGRIINIGSISATKPRPGQSAYSASKAGLVSLTRSTLLEGRAFGISAGCLHPGLVDVTPESSYAGPTTTPDEPAIAPQDIAEAALAMAQLPPHVTMLDTTVLPSHQIFIGRG